MTPYNTLKRPDDSVLALCTINELLMDAQSVLPGWLYSSRKQCVMVLRHCMQKCYCQRQLREFCTGATTSIIARNYLCNFG